VADRQPAAVAAVADVDGVLEICSNGFRSIRRALCAFARRARG
jgi:hypothetical protein